VTSTMDKSKFACTRRADQLNGDILELKKRLDYTEKALWAVVLTSGGQVEVPNQFFQMDIGMLMREESVERQTQIFKAVREKYITTKAR